MTHMPGSVDPTLVVNSSQELGWKRKLTLQCSRAAGMGIFLEELDRVKNAMSLASLPWRCVTDIQCNFPGSCNQTDIPTEERAAIAIL